jgi:hypothetical protein
MRFVEGFLSVGWVRRFAAGRSVRFDFFLFAAARRKVEIK